MESRTRLRLTLAAVAVVAAVAAPAAPAQTPPAGNLLLPPLPPAAVPGAAPADDSPPARREAAKGGERADPLLPTLPTFDPPAAGCATGNCTAPGGCYGSSCDAATGPKGPRLPVTVGYTHLLLFFQPSRTAGSPLAVADRPGGPGQPLLTEQKQLGLVNAFNIDASLWLNDDHTFGLGGGGFISEQRSSFETASGGPGGVTLRRPFVNATDGSADSLLVASNGSVAGLPAFAGSVATATTARLAGAHVDLLRNLVHADGVNVTFFTGFRYYDLDESLAIYQSTTAAPGVGATVAGRDATGGTVNLFDRFYTRNQFYGGEVGGKFELCRGIVTFAVTPQVAFGNMHQVTSITGSTTVVGGPNPGVTSGGLLAAGSGGYGGAGADGNIGRYTTNRFTLTTQIGTQVGFKLTDHLRAGVGYQFLYLNNVARPGSQLDQVINQRNVPVTPAFGSQTGPGGPRPTFDRDSFYAHGATVQFELAY